MWGTTCILASFCTSNILESSSIPSLQSAHCVLLTSLLFHYVSLLLVTDWPTTHPIIGASLPKRLLDLREIVVSVTASILAGFGVVALFCSVGVYVWWVDPQSPKIDQAGTECWVIGYLVIDLPFIIAVGTLKFLLSWASKSFVRSDSQCTRWLPLHPQNVSTKVAALWNAEDPGGEPKILTWASLYHDSG